MSLVKAVWLVGILILLISMHGSLDHPRLAAPKVFKAPAEPGDLAQFRAKGNDFFEKGQYARAAGIYEEGYAMATNRGERSSAVRFLNNLGSARYQLFQYREAAKAYLEARNLASMVGDRETLGALCINLSSLYLGLGDTQAAAQSALQGRRALAGIDNSFRSKLLIQSALIELRQKNQARAVAWLGDAVKAARKDKDTATEAQAWNELGNAIRDGGDTRAAEAPLLEGYRLRKLHHDDRLCYSYQALGRLRLAQGDPRAASELFGRAIEFARHISPAALWDAYYDRGIAERAQGRLEEAFADFGAALNWMRRWRAEVLPADAFRVSSEVELHDAFSAFIEVGIRLYRETGRERFAEEAFAIAEESRTASLRALREESASLTQILPTEYWETLAHLHGAETVMAASDDPGETSGILALRLRLTELEARAGLELSPEAHDSEWRGGQVLQRTRRALLPDAAYVGFTLGASESWMWAATRETFELHRLPPEAQTSRMARLFARSVSDGRPEAASLGRDLYRQLFGSASQLLARKRVWIMALDGPLFEVPFAALVTESNRADGGPVYLVEDHALESIPGAWSLFRKPAPYAAGLFVGVGDPVYNRADPRFRAVVQTAAAVGRVRGSHPPEGTELTRLAGSDREIEQCANIWRTPGSEVVLLRGAAASKQNILDAMRRRPYVLHLAAHIVFPPQNAASGLVALSLRPQGGVEFLSTTEIASMRTVLGLVVLNGCSSAQGSVLPGAGLMGMTRAWLAAGAHAVIATRWPTPDDNTELFSFFYEYLASIHRSGESYPFARALERAQIRQLRAGGRHCGAAFWGAYFCVAMN